MRPPATTVGHVPRAAVSAAAQRIVIDEADLTLFAEPSSAMFEAVALRANRPGQIRTTPLHGAMGELNGGVLGYCLASGRPAVVLTGDGSMHLLNALVTAVAEGCAFVAIVLNDGRLGLPFHGTALTGRYHAQAATGIPATDFAAYARSIGVGHPNRAAGLRVTRTDQLDDAIRTGIAAGRPFVVDVLIDADVPPPGTDERVGELQGQERAGAAREAA